MLIQKVTRMITKWSIFSERDAFILDAFGRDDLEVQVVADVDVTLGGGDESVVDQVIGLIQSQTLLCNKSRRN